MRARRRKSPIDRQIHFAAPVEPEHATSEDAIVVFAVGRRQTSIVAVGEISFVMRRGGRDGLLSRAGGELVSRASGWRG